MKSGFTGLALVAGGTVALTAAIADAHLYSFLFGLNGHSVVEPTDSNATGTGLLVYNHHTINYDLDLRIRGIAMGDLLGVGPNGSPIGIFNAPRGQNGDLVLDPGYFGDFEQDGEFLRLQLSNIILGDDQGAFNSNIFLNETELIEGRLYMQIFTQQYPDGEIRGQIPIFRKFLDYNAPGEFAGLIGPPTRIPAPGTGLTLCALGLLAVRRRR